MAQIPKPYHWLFWDTDARKLDTKQAQNYILPRVLEFGRLEEVRWIIATYGLDTIHAFLRDVGHPELSPRTLAFWRAVFKAQDETWASPPAFRKSSAAPWID